MYLSTNPEAECPADLEASLDPMWGRLGLFESGEMSSGESQSTLGLFTQAS